MSIKNDIKTKENDIKIHCSYDKLVDLAQLKQNPENPNTHPDKQINILSTIIQKTGWRVPITVSNLSGLIVRGHARYRAAILLKCDKVPVDFQDYESEIEEWSDLLADNKIPELAELDRDQVNRIFDKIKEDDGFNLELTGFDFDELESISDEMSKTDLSVFDSIDSEDIELKIDEGGMVFIRPVLLIQDDGIFEKAIRKTKEMNRGEAIVKICKSYLDNAV